MAWNLEGNLTFGMRTVQFGTNANQSRPAGVPNGGVYWVGTGSVLPANALSADPVFLP